MSLVCFKVIEFLVEPLKMSLAVLLLVETIQHNKVNLPLILTDHFSLPLPLTLYSPWLILGQPLILIANGNTSYSVSLHLMMLSIDFLLAACYIWLWYCLVQCINGVEGFCEIIYFSVLMLLGVILTLLACKLF